MDNRKIKISIFSLGKPSSVCSVIRLISPLSSLEKRGIIEFEWGTNFLNNSKNCIYKIDNSFDIIIIQRNCPYNMVVKVLEFAESNNIRTIWETDDNLIEFFKLRNKKSSILDLEKIIKSVDHITVTNEKLKEYFYSFSKNIKVLPNCLDPDIWQCNVMGQKRSKEKIKILCSGTNTYLENIEIIRPALDRILHKYGDIVEIYLWGRRRRFPDNLLNERIKFFSDFLYDYRKSAQILQGEDFDIALTPLIDNSFNSYKSNIKYLEYSICKIPGIYSKVDPYVQSIKHMENGILVENDWNAWYKALELMIKNKDLRFALAEKAFSDVTGHYLLTHHINKWLELFKDLINSKQKESDGRSFKYLEVTNKLPLYKKLFSWLKIS